MFTKLHPWQRHWSQLHQSRLSKQEPVRSAEAFIKLTSLLPDDLAARRSRTNSDVFPLTLLFSGTDWKKHGVIPGVRARYEYLYLPRQGALQGLESGLGVRCYVQRYGNACSAAIIVAHPAHPWGPWCDTRTVTNSSLSLTVVLLSKSSRNVLT